MNKNVSVLKQLTVLMTGTHVCVTQFGTYNESNIQRISKVHKERIFNAAWRQGFLEEILIQY